MNRRQDQVLRSQHRDTHGLHGAGYHLQMSHPCEQNYLPHYSKASNSQSDPFSVDDSSEYSQRVNTIDTPLYAGGDIQDPRSEFRCTREPIDLPVPQFEIDDNCVVTHPSSGTSCLNLNNENLDLDTRIDLLIKSRALAGMHPIFSELIESEGEASDDSLISRPKSKRSMQKKAQSMSPIEKPVFEDYIDDPDKPLSRPPSPFLSRASYLFWFNKAIELKEQAKAQEQALLEKATKKLQANITSAKLNNVKKPVCDNKTLFNCLLTEISKEMKEIIKQQFINDVLETTISNSLESWWGNYYTKDEKCMSLTEHQNDNFVSLEQNKNTFNYASLPAAPERVIQECVTVTSPHGPFPVEDTLHTLLNCNKSHIKHKQIVLDKNQDKTNSLTTNEANSEIKIETIVLQENRPGSEVSLTLLESNGPDVPNPLKIGNENTTESDDSITIDQKHSNNISFVLSKDNQHL